MFIREKVKMRKAAFLTLIVVFAGLTIDWWQQLDDPHCHCLSWRAKTCWNIVYMWRNDEKLGISNVDMVRGNCNSTKSRASSVFIPDGKCVVKFFLKKYWARTLPMNLRRVHLQPRAFENISNSREKQRFGQTVLHTWSSVLLRFFTALVGFICSIELGFLPTFRSTSSECGCVLLQFAQWWSDCPAKVKEFLSLNKSWRC